MATIGKFNRLRVTKCVPTGIYVDCEQLGEIMIPEWSVTEKVKVGDEINVFLFLDPKENVVATMKRPLALPGEVALLKVAAIVSGGVALLKWGMPEYLLVPAREQEQKMVKGFSYVVYVCHDPRNHDIIGSTKLDKHLSTAPDGVQLNQEVELTICDHSELGYRAVINNVGLGFLYNNDVFRALQIGEKTKGFIKNIREDGRVDLYLQKPGYEKVIDVGEEILAKIKDSGGFIAVTDKSSAEKISEIFGVSKKTYKKAVGGLYKKGLVVLEEKGIRLVKGKL